MDKITVVVQNKQIRAFFVHYCTDVNRVELEKIAPVILSDAELEFVKIDG